MKRYYLKKIIQFFIFSNLYIAGIAILACEASFRLFDLPISAILLLFVGAATLCSYSLHWALTYTENNPSERLIWTAQHRNLLYFLSGSSGIVAAFLALKLVEFWFILLPLGIFTFIYTAPKIPARPFTYLRGKAIAKTLYLSLVWTAVIVVLPIVVAKTPWTFAMTAYLVNRFCFTFALCSLFDYRDKGDDALSGIKNRISTLTETAFDRFFYFLLSLVFCSFMLLIYRFFTLKQLCPFLFTSVLVLLFYKKTKNTSSDYWYYGILDGLMLAF